MRIGHASIDENGKAKNGKAGDQTKKEVCVRTYYTKAWKYVLRAKNPIVAEKMAVACENACANDCIGYDQNQRNSLKNQAVIANYNLAAIKVDCECDCSSFMTVCAECAGVKIPYNGTNAPTTSTMKSAFLSTGQFDVLTDSKYLTSADYLKRGDILVAPGSHTVMALDEGSKLTSKTKAEYIYGVDLSACQRAVDFEKLKAQNYKFAILRITRKSNNVDDKFEEYYNGCVKNGIECGCYKYSYAQTEEEAILETKCLLKVLGKRKIKIWYDIEDSNQLAKLGNIGVNKIAKAFLNECKKNGYEVGIYCNLNWYKNVLDAELKKYDLWIARYGKNTGLLDETYAPNVGEKIWQYTSKGVVDGISGSVDLNVVRGK